MKNVLLDTGFWRALFDDKDALHNQAIQVYNLLITHQDSCFVAWPVVYEVIKPTYKGLKSLRNSPSHFEAVFGKLLRPSDLRVYFLDDNVIRESFLKIPFSLYQNKARKMTSLVDCVQMQLLLDLHYNLGDFVTTDLRDFRLFCFENQIEFIALQAYTT